MAADALSKAAEPYHCHHPRYIDSFWTWPLGSTLFFWRWLERYQADARDGQPHFLLGDFGGYLRPQAAPKPEERENVLLKLLPVRQRGHIEAGSGKVKSLINYFLVTGSAAGDVEEVVRNVRALPRTVDVAARRLAGGPLRRGRPTLGSSGTSPAARRVPGAEHGASLPAGSSTGSRRA